MISFTYNPFLLPRLNNSTQLLLSQLHRNRNGSKSSTIKIKCRWNVKEWGFAIYTTELSSIWSNDVGWIKIQKKKIIWPKRNGDRETVIQANKNDFTHTQALTLGWKAMHIMLYYYSMAYRLDDIMWFWNPLNAAKCHFDKLYHNKSSLFHYK